MITLRDSGLGRKLQGQRLNLTAKRSFRKRTVIRTSYWLIDHFSCGARATYCTRNLVTQCLTDILKRSLNTFNNQPIGSFNVYYNPCFLTGRAD